MLQLRKLVKHSNALVKLGGEEGFLSFKKALFAKGGKPTLEVIETVAGEDGLDATAMMACVNGGEFATKVTDAMAFGRKLGVTGTPGNIVMNNETGEYKKSIRCSTCYFI